MSIVAAVLAAVSVAATLTDRPTVAVVTGAGAAVAAVTYHVRRRREANRGRR